MDWIQKGILITEEEWHAHIARLHAQVKERFAEKENLLKFSGVTEKEILKQTIVSAVHSRIPKNRFGIFLSGGVDSSLIAFLCKKAGTNPLCVSVGMETSPDVLMAKKLAEQLKLELVTKEFTLSEAEELFKKTAVLFSEPEVLSVGVGAVVAAAAELGKANGVTTFFGGLGSEEIFAGYERHSKSTNINEECWKGLKHMWKRDLVRDFTLGKTLGITVLTPFLDEKLIVEAMAISGERKIAGEHKKLILREVAEELGLPKEFAWRKRQAAQYGSKLDWAMEKLAKKKGMDKGEYVRGLKGELKHN